MKVNLKYFFFLILFFIFGFGAGYYFNLFNDDAGLKKLGNEPDFSPIFKSWDTIQEKFVNFKEEDKQKIIYGAVKGMVKALGDPYSDFLDPQETKDFEEGLNGIYEGIGAEIGIKDEILTIISPIKGTPAETAGLLSEDKILEINGEPTKDMTLVQAVMKIRGEKGTTVKLKIKRGEDVFEKEIIRAKIEIPLLNYKELEGNIALIEIYNFFEDAASKFEGAYQNVLNSGRDKIILDLRNNPGGHLSAATGIADFFVEKGKVILKEDMGKEGIEETKSKGPGALGKYKTVILINKGSASASEILAGTIKENNPENVLIIGEKSFGKGTVQQFIPLEDDSSLKLTIARWLLPSGKSIEGEGITPDIEVIRTEEDLKQNKDPQLDRAIEELNKK